MQLTNDADKVICCIYKIFLQKRKNGIDKSDARRFKLDTLKGEHKLSSWSDSDLTDALMELIRSKLVDANLGATFKLSDLGIVYMENRFKNGLNDVVDFISKLLP